MPSTRRRFLLSAALATSLAGCTGGESDDPEDTTVEMTRVETTATSPRTTGTTATDETTDATDETTTVEPRKETPESEAVRWRVAVDAPVSRSPAVGEDGVYVAVGKVDHASTEKAESTGALVGLAAADGAPQWTTELPANPMAAPQFHDGGVYCVSGGSSGFWGIDNRLHRFDRDGTERWRTDGVDQFLDVLAFGDGRAYLGTSDDALGFDGQRLFAVGLSEGRTEWSVESGDAYRGRFLDGTVVVDIGGGEGVAVHDASSGDRRWMEKNWPLGNRTEPFSVVDGALLVERSDDERQHLAALDATDGSERWQYRPDHEERFSPTAAGVVGNTVVGLTYGGRVFGLDTADGTERWSFDAGGEYGSLVVSDQRVFVLGGTDGGRDALYALDAATGSEQWRVSRSGIRPFDLIDGTVVVTDGNRNRDSVSALDATDGTERWSFETSEGLTQPVVADGRVYVASETGVIRALGE